MPGDDVDAAEKLIGVVGSATGEEKHLGHHSGLRRSAGTLMALGANGIAMSDSSELGPIDPQVSSQAGNGSASLFRADYLNAYDAGRRRCATRQTISPQGSPARQAFESVGSAKWQRRGVRPPVGYREPLPHAPRLRYARNLKRSGRCGE
ncbi:hypothetical protein [Bradyrhizobium sp. UFLA01-814]|uniref:hypothetical protein n=1 Tax=Bradyrhizobium sp. UFLA01-814 TaxID=3023480 RepID=UPI00398A7FCB